MRWRFQHPSRSDLHDFLNPDIENSEPGERSSLGGFSLSKVMWVRENFLVYCSPPEMLLSLSFKIDYRYFDCIELINVVLGPPTNLRIIEYFRF